MKGSETIDLGNGQWANVEFLKNHYMFNNQQEIKMEKVVSRITVEPAQNGFLVYLNENIILGGVRQQPYVFETMENLLKFIELKIKGTNGI